MKWGFQCTLKAVDDWLAKIERYVIRTIFWIITGLLIGGIGGGAIILIGGILATIVGILFPPLLFIFTMIVVVVAVSVAVLGILITMPVMKYYVLSEEEGNHVELIKKAFKEHLTARDMVYFLKLTFLLTLGVGAIIVMEGISTLLPPPLNLLMMLVMGGIGVVAGVVALPILGVAAYRYDEGGIIENLKKGAGMWVKKPDDALGFVGTVIVDGVVLGLISALNLLIIKYYVENRCDDGVPKESTG
ncbi:MAG: hypothetical protein GXN92_02945 [Candidatus Micrarchaeota archaeon]|nr:hypothetical protein [Candidatus Micrarchaeota archaeon]